MIYILGINCILFITMLLLFPKTIKIININWRKHFELKLIKYLKENLKYTPQHLSTN